jgi:hypothetical protein
VSLVLLSTECVNNWCAECRYTGCACPCHSAGTSATPDPPPPKPMPASRERVYAALVDHHQAHGYAPSTRDLCAATGLAAGTVNYHVHRLEAAGRVRFSPGRARTVTPITTPRRTEPGRPVAPAASARHVQGGLHAQRPHRSPVTAG